MNKFKYFLILILMSYVYKSNEGNDEYSEEHQEHHVKIPFGTPKFFLFIFYAVSCLKSSNLFCGYNVWFNSRIFFNSSTRFGNHPKKRYTGEKKDG